MNTESNKVVKKQPEMPHQGVNKSRRSFAKGGMAVAPVIMSLASRPVWASRTCSYSGQLSGYISGPSFNELCQREGLSPGFWGTHPEEWHVSFPTTLLFKDVFGDYVGFEGVAGGGTPTLLEVMNSAKTPEPSPKIISKCSTNGLNQGQINNLNNMAKQLAFHAVAALQNSASPLKYPITVVDLIAQVNAAFSSCVAGTMGALKDILDDLNNKGGTL